MKHPISLLNPLIQNKAIQRSHYRFTSEKIPERFHGFKIAMISDLHNTRFGQNQKRLVFHLQKCQPDIIVFTGD